MAEPTISSTKGHICDEDVTDLVDSMESNYNFVCLSTGNSPFVIKMPLPGQKGVSFYSHSVFVKIIHSINCFCISDYCFIIGDLDELD